MTATKTTTKKAIVKSSTKKSVKAVTTKKSTAAKIIGENIMSGEAKEYFNQEVRMWVFDEKIPQPDGSERMLTEIINTDHENVKYLKGHKLPEIVKAVPDLKEAVQGATALVWVLPHQFIPKTAMAVKDG